MDHVTGQIVPGPASEVWGIHSLVPTQRWRKEMAWCLAPISARLTGRWELTLGRVWLGAGGVQGAELRGSLLPVGEDTLMDGTLILSRALIIHLSQKTYCQRRVMFVQSSH